MCGSATIQLIEEVVEEKVRAGAMFTAFDVSLEVKRRGVCERHRDMKRFVHASHDRGQMGTGYQRTLVRIPGAPARAWLYHQLSDDPAAYQPRPRSRKAGRSNGGGFRVDGRSRLCVPVAWLRAAGLLPGNEAYVTSDDSARCLVLTRQRPDAAGALVLQTYRVEKDGNVRVAKTTLRRAGLTGPAYDIDGDATRVTLRLRSPDNPPAAS